MAANGNGAPAGAPRNEMLGAEDYLRIEAVRKEYGIAAERVKTSGGESWSHSSFTYLIDRAGLLRALVPYGTPVDDTVHDLKILLEL